jgi:hypothetical protein
MKNATSRIRLPLILHRPLAATAVPATDLTWTGTVSNDWNSPAMWKSTLLPATIDRSRALFSHKLKEIKKDMNITTHSHRRLLTSKEPRGARLCGPIALAALMLFHLTTARAGVVATAQDLQSALTAAAANGGPSTIQLAAGYYSGNFNFNSAQAYSLTLQGAQGTTNTQIVIDGAGTGLSMSLSCSANADITIQGITFVRNGHTGLHVATGVGGNVQVQDCLFVPPASGASGLGLEIASGQSATVLRCTAAGQGGVGTGISISGLAGGASIMNCTFNANLAGYSRSGGGLNVSVAGALTISGSTFTGNGAHSGGGAYCSANSILLFSNVFSSCSCLDWGYGDGSAAYLNASSVTVSNNTFSGNTGVSVTGTAVSVGSGYGPYLVSGNVFVGNGAGFSGSGALGTLAGNTFANNLVGGANASASGLLTVSGNSFNGNGVVGVPSSGVGSYGGAFCSADTLAVYNNSFVGNVKQSYSGGGLGCTAFTTATVSNNTFTGNSAGAGYGVGGGGVNVWRPNVNGSVALLNNTFSGNVSALDGGGVYCPFWASSFALTLSGNVFKRNAASGSGGGIFVGCATLRILDNLFVQNSAVSDGGGVWANPSTSLDMVNNTVVGNTNSGNGGGAAFQVNNDGTGILHVYNNIIWGNMATGQGADVYLKGTGQRREFLFNDTDDMSGIWDLALNNRDVDPQFFDPVNGDYHLRPTSGCVDAGTNGAPAIPAVDLDGGARIANGIVDLGCYESSHTAFHPADADTNWVMGGDEFNSYAAAWQNSQSWTTGPSPVSADFVTRAGFLLQSGGTYHNDGSAQPTNWKPGAQ